MGELLVALSDKASFFGDEASQERAPQGSAGMYLS